MAYFLFNTKTLGLDFKKTNNSITTYGDYFLAKSNT